MSKYVKDTLGNRIKEYEQEYRILLPPKSYNILRLDGRAFHTLTKSFKRPCDELIMNAMDEAAKAVLQDISGSVFAYVQSDEIQILFSDLQNERSELWFNGNIQKITSVSSGIASSAFCKSLIKSNLEKDFNPAFDARVFQVPDKMEVFNAFWWRQKDATRNAISSIAQSIFSPKQLHGVKTVDVLKMIESSGDKLDNYNPGFCYGRFMFNIRQLLYIEELKSEAIRNKCEKIIKKSILNEREWFLSLIP